MTIKDLLDSLPKEDRKRLNYAFEHGIGQFALLPDGRYVGVNVSRVPFLIPENTVGSWSVGRVGSPTGQDGIR